MEKGNIISLLIIAGFLMSLVAVTLRRNQVTAFLDNDLSSLIELVEKEEEETRLSAEEAIREDEEWYSELVSEADEADKENMQKYTAERLMRFKDSINLIISSVSFPLFASNIYNKSMSSTHASFFTLDSPVSDAVSSAKLLAAVLAPHYFYMKGELTSHLYSFSNYTFTTADNETKTYLDQYTSFYSEETLQECKSRIESLDFDDCDYSPYTIKLIDSWQNDVEIYVTEEYFLKRTLGLGSLTSLFLSRGDMLLYSKNSGERRRRDPVLLGSFPSNPNKEFVYMLELAQGAMSDAEGTGDIASAVTYCYLIEYCHDAGECK